MKKGFTLIELLVSLVLVAVVLTSMSAALVKLKSTYDKANDVTDIDLVTSSITRIISKDILSLKNLVDTKLINEKTIELFFSDGKKRTIIIENIDGFETKCIKNENSGDNDYIGTKRMDKSTLKYIDSTDPNNEKILYIKTFDYTCSNNERTCKNRVLDEECTSTNGNKFIGFDSNNINKSYSIKGKSKVVFPLKLIIKLNNTQYNISIPLLEISKVS